MIIDTLIIKMILIVDSWRGVGGSASEVTGLTRFGDALVLLTFKDVSPTTKLSCPNRVI